MAAKTLGDIGGHVVRLLGETNVPVRVTKMKEHRPDHLRENTGVASLPIEGGATSNWAIIDAGMYTSSDGTCCTYSK